MLNGAVLIGLLFAEVRMPKQPFDANYEFKLFLYEIQQR